MNVAAYCCSVVLPCIVPVYCCCIVLFHCIVTVYYCCIVLLLCIVVALFYYSVLWHPTGESSTLVVLADSHMVVCDLEPSSDTAKVCDLRLSCETTKGSVWPVVCGSLNPALILSSSVVINKVAQKFIYWSENLFIDRQINLYVYKFIYLSQYLFIDR